MGLMGGKVWKLLPDFQGMQLSIVLFPAYSPGPTTFLWLSSANGRVQGTVQEPLSGFVLLSGLILTFAWIDGRIEFC